MALVKPQLRNIQVSRAKVHVMLSVGFAMTVAATLHFLVSVPRKQRYADFYKKYDPEKQLKILNESGQMQSYKP